MRGKELERLLVVAYEQGSFHPSVIRHVNFPALLRTGWLALEVVDDAGRRREFEACTWDELVVDPALAERFDLPDGLEERLDGGW